MSKDLMKRLYYISMFDGYLTNSIKGNSSLIINMLEKNNDYIMMVADVLNEIPLGYKITNPEPYAKDGYVRQQQTRIASHNHPILTKIRNRIYLGNNKVLDPHMLTLMDEEALAIAFMADGSRQIDKRWVNARPIYRLHVNNLSYGDVMLLKKSLKNRLGLESNAQKKGHKWDLVVPTFHSELFEAIVEDFILPSFQYKLGR